MAWFVLQCKSNFEGVAQRKLKGCGFTTYLPKIFDFTRCCRTVLYRGYLLAREIEEWPELLLVGRGSVIGILKAGDKPGTIPDRHVQALKRKTQFGLVVLEPPKPPLAKGDKVRLIKGALKGQDAIYEGPASGDRVALTLWGAISTLARRDQIAAV